MKTSATREAMAAIQTGFFALIITGIGGLFVYFDYVASQLGWAGVLETFFGDLFGSTITTALATFPTAFQFYWQGYIRLKYGGRKSVVQAIRSGVDGWEIYLVSLLIDNFSDSVCLALVADNRGMFDKIETAIPAALLSIAVPLVLFTLLSEHLTFWHGIVPLIESANTISRIYAEWQEEVQAGTTKPKPSSSSGSKRGSSRSRPRHKDSTTPPPPPPTPEEFERLLRREQ